MVKGKAINFSYFSPYDVVRQPYKLLLKTIEEGKFKTTRCRICKEFNVRKRWTCKKTLLDPFISESIALEKTLKIWLPAGELYIQVEVV